MDLFELYLEVLAVRRCGIFLLFFLCLIANAVMVSGIAHAEDTFIALSYHDILDNVSGDLDPDRTAVGTHNLIRQFSWLREHGYQPVSLNDLVAAGKGKQQLPEKAVLLTFDDGFASMYTRVFPLLKMFQYPAVLSIVGSWMETESGQLVQYGDRYLARDRFLSWEQVREMIASGLVEVASHSYDLHRGVLGNPQGNVQPVVTTLQYFPESKTYEDTAAHRRLLREDIQKNISLIEQRTGVRPRCITWPYGLENRAARDEAKAAGQSINMDLGDQRNRTQDLSGIYRLLLLRNPDLEEFIWYLTNFETIRDPIRVAHVDLDYVFDPDQEQQNRNLDRLIERIKRLKINTVYLQAFSDADGDGVSESLYFPNRHLPMREDLFNRVAWQLKTRAEVAVYAWMPTLSFKLPDRQLNERLLVHKLENGETTLSKDWYPRLSPFQHEARKIISEIYEDLAAHASFAGLLFHDDAYISDFEDASPAALTFYKNEWGLPADLEAIRQDQALFKRWSRLKSRALAQFTDELAGIVKQYRTDLKTARNMYAAAVLNPEAEDWLAQSMEVFLDHYDYVAVMAMPYMEKIPRPDQWLDGLVNAVASHETGLKRTVFELQSVRWDLEQRLDAAVLFRQMRRLQRQGAVNFGYYPDDFIQGYPMLDILKAGISLEKYPYEQK